MQVACRHATLNTQYAGSAGNEQYPHQGDMHIVKASNILLAQMRLTAIVLTLALAWAGMIQDSRAAPGTENSLEYSVKGAYLFKFGDFVEWPASAFALPDTPLVIAVLGDDPFGRTLDELARGRTIAGRTVTVQRTEQIEEALSAHILYISQSERNKMKPLLPGMQDRHVLTVADFDQPGIIITFVIDNDKVRFNVNLDQAERASLKLSSKLLNVAKTVRGK